MPEKTNLQGKAKEAKEHLEKWKESLEKVKHYIEDGLLKEAKQSLEQAWKAELDEAQTAIGGLWVSDDTLAVKNLREQILSELHVLLRLKKQIQQQIEEKVQGADAVFLFAERTFDLRRTHARLRESG